MNDWQTNYKSMDAKQLSAEYQKLLTRANQEPELGDKLKFLKLEFAIKNKAK